jgi:hypothetical protein
MTTSTDDLIRQLSRDVPPAPPLRHPFLRAAAWVTGAALYVALVVAWMAPAGALATHWSDVSFTLQQLAAAATAFTAAAAAFSMTIPGRGRATLFVSIAAAGVWVGLVLSGCIQDWIAAGRAGLALRSDWPCVAGILMTGAVPALALAAMLRRGAPLVPRTTTALGAIAITSLASAGMCLAQSHERDVIVLAWHGATIVSVSVLAAIAGRAILNWKRLSLAGVGSS